MAKKVILVDKKNRKIGHEEKVKAHREGKLHRAFSVFIFNKKKEILLQKRAKTKYHSGGLWTNTCCSHPEPGEKIKAAAEKRLKKEMGIKTKLRKNFSFYYKAKIGKLVEHEIDHVFIGKFNGNPKPNKKEVTLWRWASLPEIKNDIKKCPQKYTSWFKIIIKKYENMLSRS